MRDELISNNLKLIDFAIYKMNLGYKIDEYYDIGLNALVEAGKTFDESKGNKFSGYAFACIKNEILKQVAFEKAIKRQSNVNTISFDSEIYCNDNNIPITLLDIYDDGTNLEEEIIKREKIDLLKTIINILEPKDKFMIEHNFELWGKQKISQENIAKILGVKKSYVPYRINRSMRIIKKIMEDKYGEEN